MVDLQCVNFCLQQSDCYTYILFFYSLFHYGLLQDIEYNSQCYTVGPCYLDGCISVTRGIIATQWILPDCSLPTNPWRSWVAVHQGQKRSTFTGGVFFSYGEVIPLQDGCYLGRFWVGVELIPCRSGRLAMTNRREEEMLFQKDACEGRDQKLTSSGITLFRRGQQV